MKITLGILAWNERENISLILSQLTKQSIFKDTQQHIDLIVVANGCTDSTVEVAENFISTWSPRKNVQFKIAELPIAGKANAWNQLVHHLSSPDTEVFVIFDADITFVNEDTIATLVNVLIKSATAQVVSSCPIKDIDLKTRRTLIERIISKKGKITKAQPGQLCGQLYAIKGGIARKIYIPINLIIDDGFIKEMVATDFLKKNVNNELVQTTHLATHIFKQYTRLRQVFRNQVRQTVGQALYFHLKEWLLKQSELENIGVSGLIIKMNSTDPDWLKNEIIKNCSKNHWFLIPAQIVCWPLIRLKNLSFKSFLKQLPVSMITFLANIPVSIISNRKLKSGQITNIWR